MAQGGWLRRLQCCCSVFICEAFPPQAQQTDIPASRRSGAPHLDDAAAQLLAVVEGLQQADLLAGCLVRQLVRLRLEGAHLQTTQPAWEIQVLPRDRIEPIPRKDMEQLTVAKPGGMP